MFRSSFVVLLSIGLLNQYAYCMRDVWWNSLMRKADTRHNKQWAPIANSTPRDMTAQTTNRSIRKSSVVFDSEEVTDEPIRSKSWDKTYARRRSYKSNWADGQPLRERFVETEWDDDTPVRHIVRDSAIDEGDRVTKSEEQHMRTSRPSFRDDFVVNVDNGGDVRPIKETFSNTRITNNEQPAISKSWDSRHHQPKPERLLNIKIESNEPKKVADEKWNKLVHNIFNMKNERQTFKDSGNDFVKPAKPKFTVLFESTPATAMAGKQSAKLNDEQRQREDNGKNSGRDSTQRFGWRSSVNHGNNQEKSSTARLVQPRTTTVTFADITTTTATTATTKPKEITFTTTTRNKPKELTFTTTSRAKPKEITFTTTSRAKLKEQTPTTTSRTEPKEVTFTSTTRAKPKPPKASINALTDSLSTNKKQHRIGSWVDSENLSINEREESNWSDSPVRSQPLVQEEHNEEQEQITEKVDKVDVDDVDDVDDDVENIETVEPLPQPNARQSANQRVKSTDKDEPENWRLEDALPGTPGTDYPIYARVPKTSFDCKNQEWPGYYADVEAQCQVFHICQTGGRKNSFLCPNGTMFNQKLFVCDWWHNVQCEEVSGHYQLNANIYDSNWESKRTESSPGTREVRRSGAAEVEPLTPSRNMATTLEPIENEEESKESSVELTEKPTNTEIPQVFIDEEDMTEDDNDNNDNDFNRDMERMAKSARIREPVRQYKAARFSPHSSRFRRVGYLKA